MLRKNGALVAFSSDFCSFYTYFFRRTSIILAFSGWIYWPTMVRNMYDKADFIDPFIQREDEFLSPNDIVRLLSPDIIKTTEETQDTSYGFGYRRDTTYSYWQIKNMWKRR